MKQKKSLMKSLMNTILHNLKSLILQTAIIGLHSVRLKVKLIFHHLTGL